MGDPSANGRFEPPIPTRMSFHLDQVTEGKVRAMSEPGGVYRLSVKQLEGALALIQKRPDAAERKALLAELDKRFIEYGRRAGWIDKREERPPDDIITKYIVEDIFGIKGPQDKLHDELKKDIHKRVRDGLNATGKKSYTFWKFIYKLITAETREEAARVLMDAGQGGLGVLASKKYRAIVHKLKWARVPLPVRNRLIKAIASIMLWKNVRLAALLARLNPYMMFTSVMLYLEEIGHDDQALFMLFYGKVKAENKTPFEDLVIETHGREWRYRMSPLDALYRQEANFGSGGGASGNGGPSAEQSGPEMRLP